MVSGFVVPWSMLYVMLRFGSIKAWRSLSCVRGMAFSLAGNINVLEEIEDFEGFDGVEKSPFVAKRPGVNEAGVEVSDETAVDGEV